MLKEGDKAPDFELPSDRGGSTRLSALKGKAVVVYFYPRDNTPGCTREAIGFTGAAKDFAKLGATVLGISKDSIASHCSFREKHKIGFPLLSDADLSVHKAYGAWGEKMMYGKKVTGVVRSTFVIGPDGRLAKVFSNVKVDGHVDAVLRALRGDEGAGTKVKSTPAAAPRRATKKTAEKSRTAAKKPIAKKATAKKALAAPKKGAGKAKRR